MILNFLNLSTVIGGQEIYLYNLIKKLDLSFEIRLFANDKFIANFSLEDLNIKIIRIPSIDYLDFIKLKRMIGSYTSEDGIFIFNGNRAVYLGGIMPYKYKKIAIQHSSLIDSQDGTAKSLIRKFVYKTLLLNYDKLIGVSYNTIKPIADSKKVSVNYNGIDVNKFKPISYNQKKSLRERLGFGKKENLILMIGTLTKNKGQLKAIKVIENLGENYKLILVGDGPLKTNIKNIIREKELDDRIYLVGEKSDVRDYYLVSDILLSLSNNEGLPLTILEAMASGIPIITTRVGGIPELITDYQNGIFIDKNDIKQIIKSIKLIIENNELTNKIIKNNFKKIYNDFTLEENVDRFLKIIRQISN